MSRPNTGAVTRPVGGGGRPNIGSGSSIGGGNRPNIGSGNRPGGGATTLPGVANRPNIGSGNRPGAGGGNPGIGAGNRPGIGGGNTPGIGGGNRPGIGGGNTPGIGGGNRPGIGGGNTPGIGGGNRPGIGGDNRPGIGGGNRPGIGEGNRPGVGNGNRPGIADGNRPNFNGNRPNWSGNGNFNHNNINVNNIHNNLAVSRNNQWNNGWHHGYWGGGMWGPGVGWGAGAGWGLGYAAGYRNGFWGGYYNRPWYSSALLWGMTGWGLGSIFYNSGYGMYSNPYYASNTYYDYSQPIQVINQPLDPATDGGAAAPPPNVQSSQTHLQAAQTAFLAADYVTAGNEVELAIKDAPTDAALHEFRALIYFATKDYSKAAGTLYAVLSAGPGWDWTTMSSLYPSVAVYTEQLRALEAYVKANPMSADARFVLAYQYITATHKDAAVRQLQEVVRLQPNDQLSAQLLASLGSQTPVEPGATPPAAADGSTVATAEQPAPPDIDPAKIVGKRTAKRDDGTSFTLDLTADNKFTWSFERMGKTQQFGGTYSVDGAVLVLERDDKSTMPGLLTMEDNGFNFKIFGAPDSDPGLDFKS